MNQFELTRDDMKQEPGVLKYRESEINENVEVLKEFISSVLYGDGISDSDIIKNLADDEEVRERFEEFQNLKPEQRTFNFGELFMRKIELYHVTNKH